jgi:transcriptional regulator with XRE-family HTH domain
MTLKELRLQNKLTAVKVAEKLGVARSTYSNYEQGIRTIDINLIIPLSKVFDCTAEDIVEAQINSCQSVQ